MTARESILKSWWNSRRLADVTGCVTLSHAAFAGFALEAADGDVGRALGMVPGEMEVFWACVRSDLELVACEERPRTQAERDAMARELGYENATPPLKLRLVGGT